MAQRDHVRLLKQGVAVWNEWRRGRNLAPELSNAGLEDIDLSGADLRGANLVGARFTQSRLEGADLTEAKLNQASLIQAQLQRANFTNASLSGANLAAADLTAANFYNAGMDACELSWANLFGANLSNTDLTIARFRASNLRETNLTNALLDGTLFVDVNLEHVIGLETCEHFGPSVVDHITLQKSGPLSAKFLRGAGLQEALIAALASLFETRQYSTCFISYSNKDKKFADQIHKDLQLSNVRCWYAPHDMPIGGKVLDEIDSAIGFRDKVLLILSENSIGSEWVEDEVTRTFEHERNRGHTILLPVRLDDSIIESRKPWAAKLRSRHIGDFRRWRTPKEYEKALEALRRDLLRK